MRVVDHLLHDGGWLGGRLDGLRDERRRAGRLDVRRRLAELRVMVRLRNAHRRVDRLHVRRVLGVVVALLVLRRRGHVRRDHVRHRRRRALLHLLVVLVAHGVALRGALRMRKALRRLVGRRLLHVHQEIRVVQLHLAQRHRRLVLHAGALPLAVPLRPVRLVHHDRLRRALRMDLLRLLLVHCAADDATRDWHRVVCGQQRVLVLPVQRRRQLLSRRLRRRLLPAGDRPLLRQVLLVLLALLPLDVLALLACVRVLRVRRVSAAARARRQHARAAHLGVGEADGLHVLAVIVARVLVTGLLAVVSVVPVVVVVAAAAVVVAAVAALPHASPIPVLVLELERAATALETPIASVASVPSIASIASVPSVPSVASNALAAASVGGDVAVAAASGLAALLVARRSVAVSAVGRRTFLDVMDLVLRPAGVPLELLLRLAAAALSVAPRAQLREVLLARAPRHRLLLLRVRALVFPFAGVPGGAVAINGKCRG